MARLWSVCWLVVWAVLVPQQRASAYPAGWSDDMQVSFDTMRVQGRADINVDADNNVWVVWDDADWWDGDIWFTKLDSLGNILIPETNLSNNVTKSLLARVAVDMSNNVQVIWRDYSEQGYGLWHAKITNDGTVLVPPHLAVTGAGGSVLEFDMAVDKYQNIDIAWPEVPGQNVITFTKLDSMGVPIIERLQVSPNVCDAYWCGIAVDSMANCHIGYRSDSVGYTNMLAYSKIDSMGNVLIPYLVLVDGSHPVIACDAHQNVHMAYPDQRGPLVRIQYLKLDNNGNILCGPETLTNSVNEGSMYVDMALDSNQCLHAVWEGWLGDTICPVMYTKLDTSGHKLIPAIQIVFPPYTVGGGEPRIAVDHNDKLHVVWHDGRVPYGHIFTKYGENASKLQDIAQGNCISSACLKVEPNPFSSWIRIDYADPGNDEATRLTIYNTAGRVVYSRYLNGCSPGVVWFGQDNAGCEVPAGVYFVQVRSAARVFLQKIIKLR
jgi:hypothetical protein